MEERTAVYLVMVSDQNNNKYYRLENNGDGTFTARWGRVEGHESSKIYPMSKWDSTIRSKEKKGYKNVTDLMMDVIEDSKVEDTIDNKVDKFSLITIDSIKEVIKRLYDYANKVVESAYKVKAKTVTQAMIDKAQKIIDNLANIKDNLTLDEFNQQLLELFTVIPRRMSDTRDYLAHDIEDYNKIIIREQDTLDAMAGMVYQRKQIQTTEQESSDQSQVQSILDEMGITMEETEPYEDELLKKLMGDVSDKFYRAWSVCNKDTEERYKNFQKKHDLESKLCCHGSRNANWINILKTGLCLKPSNVVINGKMFGFGTYFSNPDKPIGGVRKSIGYTSLHGSYWVGGDSNCGFLAFFEVALGKPYNVYSFDSKYYNMDLKRLKQEDSEAWHLWAHGNTSMLKNDELVVYTEEQMTIRYLVEIR